MAADHTREPQYERALELERTNRRTALGLMTNQAWHDDPKHLLFTLSRYKFVAKMLAGRKNVLEIGCADAFATRIVQQAVGKLTATDFDPVFINDAKERMNPRWAFEAFVHDMLAGAVPGNFDAAYALDVFEHIEPHQEDEFLRNVVASLCETGIAIIGIPSLESQAHASPQSKAGHVNCKTGEDFKRTLERHFHAVFVFSMNDEVVHTGFYPMANYLLGVACHRKIAT